MGNGDLSADLTLGVLTPASSVRPVEGHSLRPEDEGKGRRRSRPEEKDAENEGEEASPDAGDSPPHQLDHLA